MDKDNKKPKDKVKLQQEEAANLVREKLKRLYGDHEPVVKKILKVEPSAKEEIAEVKKIVSEHRKMSKHQQFMNKLAQSGLSLAEIQVGWHKYYEQLTNKGKHEVWDEFYAEHQRRREKSKTDASKRAAVKDTSATTKPAGPSIQDLGQSRSQPEQVIGQPIKTPQIKKDILKRISSRAKKNNKKSHWHSLAFGLTTGLITMLILLFSFFNERFITPFIRPSHNVSATPIIVDPSQTGHVGPEPRIIIPKINVEAPVVFDEPSIDEDRVQKALERGVVHYGITSNPGENGNSVIFGHSSSNILNSGEYKFAFLLLKSLEKDDTFYVQKDGKRYVYKVFNKFITTPDDVSVLDPPKDRKAISTLITCDPPGFSTNRLIIQAEQIFPDPAKNTKNSVDSRNVESEPSQLPSNSPSLWSRVTDWF
jgi:LPXTG-site transpeptidase (sortase) family protein